MITYFLEATERHPITGDQRGVQKNSWQMTCQVWMRRAFKGKAGRDWENERDKSRMYRKTFKVDQKLMIPLDVSVQRTDDSEPRYPSMTAEQRSIEKFNTQIADMEKS